MFERMVLAVDRSEHSRRATAVAGELARLSGGEVIVVHVVEHEATKTREPIEPPQEAAELLHETLAALRSAGAKASGEVKAALIGRTASVIVETATEERADLIVMGTRGLSDLAGLVLGSVTHKVLHLASCPVLVAR